MSVRILLLILLCCAYCAPSKAGTITGSDTLMLLSEQYRQIESTEQWVAEHYQRLSGQGQKKLTAAILCITLGTFGVHRLYLGTKPYVPAVYVGTLGGGIGILPFIDFIVIAFCKDISRYQNNNKVFMWANKTNIR